MDTIVEMLASLAYVDAQLDELEDEYGDLPDRVEKAREKTEEKKAIVEESQSIFEEVKEFRSKSKNTLQDLKDKEEKLSKQQFLVRNNKEFDAITKEIENVRFEFNRLQDEMRTIGVKEENLSRTIEQQQHDFEMAEKEYLEIKEELNVISSGQNEEVEDLKDKRDEIAAEIDEETMTIYNRIRKMFPDAVVEVRKNSCSGCYSTVPPQRIVEIRNNFDTLFFCESCGRILYPSEAEIHEDLL